MDCEHSNTFSDFERGDVICRDCGLVLDREYVPQHYKIQEPQQITARSTQFTALGDRPNIIDGMGSYIGYQYKIGADGKNQQLKAETHRKFKHLKRRYEQTTRIDGKETQYRTLTIFNLVCDDLHIPNPIAKRTCTFFRKLCPSLNGQSPRLIATCLYIAVKEARYTLSITEIANAFSERNHRVTSKGIMETTMEIKPLLRALLLATLQEKVIPTLSEAYLPQLIPLVTNDPQVKTRLAKAGISEHDYAKYLLTEGEKLLKTISKAERGGRNPRIFAVATIYAVNQLLNQKYHLKHPIITQNQLALVTNTAEYSIRDHWRSPLLHYVS